MAYFAKQDKGALSDAALAQRSRALTLIGEIAHKRGNLDAALKRYQEALAGTAEALRRAPADPQRLFDHAQSVFCVGSLALERGRVDEAAARYEEYRQLAAQMIASAPSRAISSIVSARSGSRSTSSATSRSPSAFPYSC